MADPVDFDPAPAERLAVEPFAVERAAVERFAVEPFAVEPFAVERFAVERPVFFARELVDELPVLFDWEVRVLRRLEPPLELDPAPPLLACGI